MSAPNKPNLTPYHKPASQSRDPINIVDDPLQGSQQARPNDQTFYGGSQSSRPYQSQPSIQIVGTNQPPPIHFHFNLNSG